MQYNINKWFGNPIFITKLDDYKTINKEIKDLINKEIKPTNSQFAKLRTLDQTLLYKKLRIIFILMKSLKNYLKK